VSVTIANRQKKNFCSQLAAKTLKAALLNSYTPNSDHNFVSDLTNEISGNGYARVALTSIVASQDDTNDWGKLTSATIDFGAVGPAAGQAVTHLAVFDDAGGSDAARELVAVYTCVATLNSGNFSATIPANGLLTIA
jgi:hypothetical protein